MSPNCVKLGVTLQGSRQYEYLLIPPEMWDWEEIEADATKGSISRDQGVNKEVNRGATKGSIGCDQGVNWLNQAVFQGVRQGNRGRRDQGVSGEPEAGPNPNNDAGVQGPSRARETCAQTRTLSRTGKVVSSRVTGGISAREGEQGAADGERVECPRRKVEPRPRPFDPANPRPIQIRSRGGGEGEAAAGGGAR